MYFYDSQFPGSYTLYEVIISILQDLMILLLADIDKVWPFHKDEWIKLY